jgi:PAS domain S-box-containing protein
VLSYVVEAAALVFLIRARSGRRNRTDMIDATIIALGLSTVYWVLQMDRTFDQSGLALLAKTFTVVYPLFDLVLVALVVRLAVGTGRRTPAFWFLVAAVIAQLGADIGYAEAVLAETFELGAPNFAGRLLSFVFLGAAALHPSMATLAQAADGRRQTSLRGRLPFLAAGALLGPAILIVQSMRGDDDLDLPLILTLMSVAVILVLTRTSDLMVDLAEHERVQTQLAGLASIVESSDDAILSWTPEGRITSWNAGATALYGYQPEEIVGRSFETLLPPRRVGEARAMLDQILHGARVGHFQSERVRKDGTLVDVSVTLSAIRDQQGDVVGGATIARDITQAKRMEAALADAADKAMEASRLKSEFLATMSHEIRTPMNGVIGLNGLLLRTELDPSQRQHAEGVRSAGEALMSIINDILDFSKIEAGKLVIEAVDFDLGQLLEEVAGLMAEGAHAKGLELVTDIQPDLPTALRGDAGRVRQVLANLSSNALKFTEQGEVVIRARLVEQAAERVTVRFEVVDTGIGISHDQRECLFDPFSQADASTTRRFGGTGLGLAISAQLTEAMGGEIGMESEPGEGSTFWFTIPLEPGHQATTAPPLAHLLAGAPVLVVDDNQTNRTILDAQLRSWDMRPEQAASALQGLACLQAAAARGERHALAVLDMHMPGMDGVELARRIAAEPALASIPLVLLTSGGDVEASTAQELGIVARLTKPARQSHLYDALVRAVAPRAHPVPVAEAGSLGPAQGSPGERGKVLVVEDNSVNQMVAVGILAQMGFGYEVVTDGVEAVEAMALNRYSAVLMDCHMPRMDGYEATAEIRKQEDASRRTPIIAMSAGALQGDRERCLEAGMDDYVAKPVTPEQVEAVLTRWVASSPPLNGHAAEDIPAVDAIDADRWALLGQMGGPNSGDLLRRMVAAFTAEGPGRVERVRRAVAGGDAQELTAAAHALAGSSATIGASHLAELCSQLERVGRSGELDSAPGLAAEVEAGLTEAVEALRSLVEVRT